MFFSIVTPIHNVARFIKQGAEGVLSQSFRDFEWILVDDGATDGSGALCDELSQKDRRVVVIHQQNAGPGPARNAGMDKAQGEYLLFYDIDDRLRPDALHKIADILQTSSPEVAVFSYSEINQSAGSNYDVVLPEIRLHGNEAVRDIYEDYLSGIRFNNGFVWNKAYKCSFIRDNNVHFKSLRIQQDEVFNLEIYPRINNMVLSSEIIYNYYVYDRGNASSSCIESRPDVTRTVRDSILSLVNKWKLGSQSLLTEVHRRFVFHFLINSIERDIFSKEMKLTRNQRIQYIQELLDDRSFKESLDFIIKSGFKPKTLFAGLYLKYAASNSVLKVYYIGRFNIIYNQIRQAVKNSLRKRH